MVASPQEDYPLWPSLQRCAFAPHWSSERQLLQRLASEGKATALSADEFLVAMFLETNGLVLIIRNTTDAIITPKGRNVLAGKGPDTRTVKKPFGFTPD